MTIYKRKPTRHFKWVIFVVVFILGMTITFADVYGVNIPSKNPENVKTSPVDKDQVSITENNKDNPDIFTSKSDPSDPAPINIEQNVTSSRDPASVPEPSTLILISSGLGLLYLRRRKKSNQ